MDLGKIGVWWSGAYRVTAEPELNAAAELEVARLRSVVVVWRV